MAIAADSVAGCGVTICRFGPVPIVLRQGLTAASLSLYEGKRVRDQSIHVSDGTQERDRERGEEDD